MDVKRELFFLALKAVMKNKKVSWKEELELRVWMELFRIAGRHQVFPMIYEVIYDCHVA